MNEKEVKEINQNALSTQVESAGAGTTSKCVGYLMILFTMEDSGMVGWVYKDNKWLGDLIEKVYRRSDGKYFAEGSRYYAIFNSVEELIEYYKKSNDYVVSVEFIPYKSEEVKICGEKQ